MPNLGFLFIPFVYFVIVGSSNAVNLTDGLDGLAITCTILVAAGLGIVAYLTSNAEYSNYLFIPYLPHAAECSLVCTSIIGAGLGFLWFNTYPAQVFMGDVGSLSLGAVLGVISVVIREEILLFVMGGIFVIETKNYSGVIYGNEDDNHWKQFVGNQKNKFLWIPPRETGRGNPSGLF